MTNMIDVGISRLDEPFVHNGGGMDGRTV